MDPPFEEMEWRVHSNSRTGPYSSAGNQRPHPAYAKRFEYDSINKRAIPNLLTNLIVVIVFKCANSYTSLLLILDITPQQPLY
jgi:hypothetical protein